jgi:hypothetical protein
MADSFILTDGTTSFELVYENGVQDDYKLQYGTQVRLSEPSVLMHEPDDGEALPIRGVDRDREVYLTANVPGDDWDTIFNNIAKIKRMVDGASSQALRYWTIGDVDRVVLRIQKDGATNYTDLPVKFGFVDDSDVYYTTIQSTIAWKPVIMLVVGPYGEGAPITLRNDLPSSPHFIEDSNSDGLADGWNSTAGGPPAFSFSTVNYLVGGQSQNVAITTSGTQGIYSDFATCDPGSDVAASIWILFGANKDVIQVRLQDGGGNTVDNIEFDATLPSGHARSIVADAGGLTWYKFELSGTTTAANARIYIFRDATDHSDGVSFGLDAAYLQVGTTTVPNAWCSTSSIENRYDPTSSDEARINYIDVWGIPGDSPAFVDWDVDTSNRAIFYYIYQLSRKDAHEVQWWVDSADFSTGIVWTSGSGTSENHYSRLGSAYSNGRIEEALDFEQLARQPLRVYVIARSSSTTPTIDVGIYAGASLLGGQILASTDAVSVSSANTWELLDLGILNLTNIVRRSKDLYVNVRVASNSGQNTDVDAVIFAPAGGENIVIEAVNKGGAAASAVPIEIYGSEQQVFAGLGSDGGTNTPFLGSLWHMQANVLNRHIFMLTDGSKEFDLESTIDIGLTITPRTRHLLGTI